MKRNEFGRLLVILTVGTVALGGLVPRCAHAHGGSRDPTVQWEQQRRRTEQRKTKRREELDDQGAEMRDAKKASEDSKQNAQMQEFGQPNQQSDRWTTTTTP
jgi:hypothetical protein